MRRLIARLPGGARSACPGLAGHFTQLFRACQAAGTVDPAEHASYVLTALGPAFIHQLASGAGADAATFAQGLRALLRH